MKGLRDTLTHRFGFRQAYAANFFLILRKRCTRRCNAQSPLFYFAMHFSFVKRVWTRYAPNTKSGAAICVQRFDDSLNPAIHITYRVSRRSSSLREPRDPSLKGVLDNFCNFIEFLQSVHRVWVKNKLSRRVVNLKCELRTVRED